jgi:hypothetical protein
VVSYCTGEVLKRRVLGSEQYAGYAAFLYELA